ncbi:MAG: allantoate amidohydrolase [Halothiobacillus sp.]
MAGNSSRVIGRCEALAKISDSESGISRLYLTSGYREGLALAEQWMQTAGMNTGVDAAGNLWGRYPANVSDHFTPKFVPIPTLILGSHLDTIPNAGKFDGILGVVCAIEVIARLHAAQKTLPFHIDVVGFGDEEGVRFPASMLGCRAVCGQWQDEWFVLTDIEGITLNEALVQQGLNPAEIVNASRANEPLIGYWEIHMEQGPVLENISLPVGIVSAIAGARRYTITLEGEAGHAGTVPMNLRRDALTAAAELVLAIEKIGCAQGIVATVGHIQAYPNAVNVIPAQVECTLDIRSVDDLLIDEVMNLITAASHAIATKRSIGIQWQKYHDAPAKHCAPKFRQLFEHAITQLNLPVCTLPSGAGHDAMLMADITDMAMLFVRCKGGISHHPDEFVAAEDAEVAVQTLLLALDELAFEYHRSEESI